jgi:hypothetical protein
MMARHRAAVLIGASADGLTAGLGVEGAFGRVRSCRVAGWYLPAAVDSGRNFHQRGSAARG